jgi:hypothetical protein
MTVGRVRGGDVHAVGSRRRLEASDVAAALMGMSAALGVLALMGALLTASVAGLDLRLDAGSLEEMAAASISTAIVLVLAAFFCGGWAYGALRERDRRSLSRPADRD